MKTANRKKIDQMSGEWTTALSIYHNVGPYVGIEDFPEHKRKCAVCGNPAKKAEHLVDKGRGGNCTAFNVIPVCSAHGKGMKACPHNYVDAWQSIYRQRYGQSSVDAIMSYIGGTHEDRLNPYRHAIESVAEDKRALQAIINSYMEQMGTKIDAFHSTSN